jgi:hypothetical protein
MKETVLLRKLNLSKWELILTKCEQYRTYLMNKTQTIVLCFTFQEEYNGKGT